MITQPINGLGNGLLKHRRKRGVDLTFDRKGVWLVIGDSNSGDSTTSTTLGPTTLPNTVFQWKNNALVEKTTQDMSNAGTIYGSQWKKFALDINAATGEKVVVANRGTAGSEAWPVDTSNHWYTDNGSPLYAPAVADAKACLAFLNLKKLRGIIVQITTNDAANAEALSNIQLAMTSLYTRLSIDFPDTPQYWPSLGALSGASGIMGSRISAIKGYFKDMSATYRDFHIPINLTAFEAWGGRDDAHYNQTGYNKIGEMLARYVLNPEPNKIVRQVQNSFHSDLTRGQKTAIKNFIQGCIADGNWEDTSLDSFQFYAPTVYNDKYGDFTLMTAQAPTGTIGGSGFDYISTPGTTVNHLFSYVIPSYARKSSQNDVVVGVYFGTVTTPAGTTGSAYAIDTPFRLLQTSGSLIGYAANDNTLTTWTAGDTKFANDTVYSWGRSGSNTKFLRKNGTQVHTASVASVTPSTNDFLLGSSRANANLNAQFRATWMAKNSAFNEPAFITRVDRLRTEWAA